MPPRRFFSWLTGWLFLWLPLAVSGEGAPLPLNAGKIRRAKEAEQQALRNKDSLQLAEAYYLYGKAYTFAGDHTLSHRYFLRALAILEPRGDSYELGRLYCRLAEYPVYLKNSHEMQYARMATDVFKRIGSLTGLTTSYSLLGQGYEKEAREKGNKAFADSALSYFAAVEKIGIRLKDTAAIAQANLLFAEFYGNSNPRCIPYLEKALTLFSAKENRRPVVNTMIILGDAYCVAGQLQRGYALLMRAKQLCEEKGMDDYQLALTLDGALVRYYEKAGMWKEAFAYHKRLSLNEKARFVRERDGAFLRLQTEYETGKKEALVKAQKRELGLNRKLMKVQRDVIVSVAMLFVLAVGVSILFFRLSRKNHRMSEKNGQLVKEQNHRLKNNLQMISSLLNLQARALSDTDARKAVQESRLRVQSMAIIQRALYDNTRPEHVDLSVFIPELTEGVLFACGYADARQVYEVAPVLLDADRITSLGFLLTELVMNACKYAFPDNPEPVLTVNCLETEGMIRFTVADNGPGFEGLKAGRETGSFGMRLVELQVNQLYGTHRFTRDKGTVFTLEFKK
ncbi:sensor histidine kinase [Ravibacter arvi]|uniref:sensor histidine kinase n=1 Tax=Ravibacter arvi TaxID=2051041 RepID=UPI0031E8ECEC